MKINQYYRQSANLSLNGSIAALVPAILIIAGNLSFFQNKQVMLLTVPFIAYSIVGFQIYLYKINRSFQIKRNLEWSVEDPSSSILTGSHLLIVYLNSYSPRLQLYHPNGSLGGEMKRFRPKGFRATWLEKWFALYNDEMKVMGHFQVKGKKPLEITVFDENMQVIGLLKKTPLSWKKHKKELYDLLGEFTGEIVGSAMYMDEQIFNEAGKQVGRLRRGWMPLEWEKRFPEPNTPILTFREDNLKQHKLLMMSLLINEYFIER
jgi:hypothetical protein